MFEKLNRKKMKKKENETLSCIISRFDGQRPEGRPKTVLTKTFEKKKKKMTRLERRLAQTMQILMLIAVSCLHCLDATICMNFQLTICEQQMRIILYLRSLISPIAVCCRNTFTFYKLLCQFWFSGRCVSLLSGNI